jgi:predicted GNAT family N-acyltransferase
MICQEITSDKDRQICLAIRWQVFVEEQGVPMDLERDGLDAQARHFAVKEEDKIIATSRVRMMGSAAKIERVAVLKEFRSKGIGMILMRYILQDLTKAGNVCLFRLSSQADAIPFYEKLGFRTRGPEYMDAGMPHYDMVKEI